MGLEDRQVLDDYKNAFCFAGDELATPILRADPSEPIRIRLVHPGGHPRQHAFTLHGHNWDPQPWNWNSTAIDPARKLLLQGTVNGIAPARHVNIVTTAGGKFGVSGDYLFRSQPSFMIDAGLWGVLRVGNAAHANNSCK
jgi:hypothetical protein